MEEELIIRLQNHDKNAFSMLYDNYSGALFGVIMKIVKTDPPAEDVLQDAFVKIWKNIENYNRDKGTLFTWLLNVARNTAIDITRSAGYKRGKDSFDIDMQTGYVDVLVPQHTIVDNIGVKELVDKLKPEHRQIIDLAYFQGYTQVEIAEELQIPLGTVKTRVKYAMNHLREIFA